MSAQIAHAEVPTARARRPARVATAVTVVGAGMIAGVYAVCGRLLFAGPGHPATDFLPVYAAASLTAHGHASAVFSLAALGHLERTLVAPVWIRHGVMPYLYPPYGAVAMVPLSRLPYTTAFAAWSAINVFLGLVTCAVGARYLRLSPRSAITVAAIGLSFPPTLIAVVQGQVSIVLLAASVAALVSFEAGRPMPAGFALALLSMKPGFLLPVLLVLVMRRQWRATLTCVGTVCALLSVGVLDGGLSPLSGYARMLQRAAQWRTQMGGFDPRWNESLPGVIDRFTSGVPATALVAATSLLVLAVVAVLALCSPSHTLAYAAAILAGLLIGPHVLAHDLALLIVPALVIVRERLFTVRTAVLLGIVAYIGITVFAFVDGNIPLPGAVLVVTATMALLFVHAALPRSASSQSSA